MGEREALLACYRSGQMSAAQWERHCEDDPELRTMVEAKGGDANNRVPIQRRPEDTSPGVKTGATGLIAAMREALEPFAKFAEKAEQFVNDRVADGGSPIMPTKEFRLTDFRRARAALAAYDAAVSPSRQSMDVEAMARELAKRASSGDTLAQSRIESNLLSFAACVAADQRERDAKIAETPDPQLANKTAAQIAAAIRGRTSRTC